MPRHPFRSTPRPHAGGASVSAVNDEWVPPAREPRKLGFTGTQDGMTEDQRAGVAAFLKSSRWAEFHHGDCIGADAEAHDIASTIGIPIVGHPPLNSKKRAFKTGFARSAAPKDYMARNQDIVDEADVLLAAPKEAVEQMRSGTWSTVRKARRAGKRAYLILPNGALR